MFSTRVPEDLSPNRLARARASAAVRHDLTVSNPTAVELPYPEGLLDALADPAGLAYRPDPRGLLSAREAVAGELRRHGAVVDPERIVLTASTSEAYAFLFKVLCDPGQAVLVPVPSYPLLEHLARVEGVEAVPYRLDAEHGWRLDVEEIAAAPESVRAAVVVHPNNPTGSHVHPEDATALAVLCARRGWALIADEVFLDFPLDGGPGAGRSFAARGDCLTFALGGLSKSVGLPQAKLSWIAVSGPDQAAAPVLERLEFVADTFLSVATAVQLAAPRLLREGEAVREAIRGRCRGNLAALCALAAQLPAVEALPVGGGWSAVVRVPAVVGEEELALGLLREDGVAVQPGYFFDFARDGYLVVSLLAPPEEFRSGVERVLARVRRHIAG
ncbi:MAG: pyridoxal phosphate-dependent aminotransferase [Acidobacteriota bacterium]